MKTLAHASLHSAVTKVRNTSALAGSGKGYHDLAFLGNSGRRGFNPKTTAEKRHKQVCASA
uniref:Uncharacterized protein n=1 Tax=Anguilla anguilla TaxID=7936 RepID=A0A0E9X589_ANGAN